MHRYQGAAYYAALLVFLLSVFVVFICPILSFADEPPVVLAQGLFAPPPAATGQPNCSPSAAVSSVSPSVLVQGQMAVVLDLLGLELEKPDVSLDFGVGIIAVGKPLFQGMVQRNKKYRLMVNVLPAAPLGVHPVRLNYCGRTKETAARVVVQAAQTQQIQGRFRDDIPQGMAAPVRPAAIIPAPNVIAVVPNQWEPGKSYSLILTGINFLEGMEVRFGNDVQNKTVVTVLSPNQAKLEVEVDPTASGLRKAQVRPDNQKAWKEALASAFVRTVVAARPPLKKITIKLPVFQPEAAPKGIIVLDKPEWRIMTGSQVPPKGPDGKPIGQPTPIYDLKHPVLNDSIVFDWHEKNFGLAEWFEIRFFHKGEVVAKRKVDGKSWLGLPFPPTHFRPDGALVAQLLQAVPAKSAATGGFQMAANVIQGTDTSLNGALAAADLAWEVAGYRRYASNGVITAALEENLPLYAAAQAAPGAVVSDAPVQSPVPVQPVTMKDVEVEISERWPLYAAGRPTGLACPAAMTTGNLNVVNVDLAAQQGAGGVKMSTTNHTFDRFVLSGTMNLAKSPYAAHAAKSQVATPDTSGTVSTPFGGSLSYGYESQVLLTTWTFENVFIDWGDGTVYPLSMTQGGDAGDYSQEKPVDLAKAAGKYEHAYAEPGIYTVRIYQLASDDVQGGGQQVAVSALNASQGKPGLYQLAMAAAGGASEKASAAEVEYGKAVADRAYMLFCKSIDIQPRTDPDANGPLHLVSIDVQGFPNAPGAKKADLSKTKGAMTKPSIGQAGPQGGQVMAQTPVVALNQLDPLALLGTMPAYSACDYQITAGGRLSYYGQGDVRLTWSVDGMLLPPEEFPVGPSKGRSDKILAQPQSTWGDPVVDTLAPLLSPPIGLQKIGVHEVRVQAEVIHTISGPGLQGLVEAALGADGKPDAALANGLLGAIKKSGAKLGVLSPKKISGGAGPAGPVSYLDEPLERVADAGRPRFAAMGSFGTVAAPLSDIKIPAVVQPKKKPPLFVESEPKQYLVLGHDSSQPCTFKFPVKGGDFLIVGLQEPGGKSKVIRVGDIFSGQGDLIVPVPTAGGVKELKAAVSFSSWKIRPDGVTVDAGTFDITESGLPETLMPALMGRFAKLKGVAGDHVDAWLDAKLANAALASSGSVAEWKGIMAELSPAGDWFAAGKPMPEILIYDSGFSLKPVAVDIDLSAKAGGPVSVKCQGDAGTGWRGVRMGNNAHVLFYDFDLPFPPPQESVNDWAIDAAGVCGAAHAGSASHPWLKGSVSWSGIDALAQGGSFKATYHDLTVHVPWLNADLKGTADPVITAGKGQGAGGITLSLTSGAKTVKNGPVTLKANNLLFTTLTGVGPGVQTDTCFDFKGEQAMFAQEICVNGLFFGLNGKAYFKDGNPQTVSLAGKKGSIAKSTVDLKSVVITAPAAVQDRLDFAFDTELSISKVLQAAKAPVSYSIDETGPGVYQGMGPVTGSFTPIQFVSPNIKATIKPVYVGPTDGSAAAQPVQFAFADIAVASDVPFQTALGETGGIIYKGSVDLTPFDLGVPVKGSFMLGYQGDTDYWAAKGTFIFPPSGAPLVPPFVNIFEIGGGLGYHVTRASLIDANLDFVQFSSDGVPVFNAHALIGSGWDSGFTFAVKGELTIKTGGSDAGVGMNYDAWLLTSSHGGKGDLYGDLTYGGGAFTGNMNGHLSIFGTDAVYVEAKNNAISFSVGSGDWYFNLGSEGNPVTGHVLVVDAGAWLSLSKANGLHVGAKADKRFPDISCDSGTCAYVQGKVKVDAGINPSPFSLSAKGSAGVDAKACASGFCLGMGVSASVHAGVPPPSFGFGYSLNGCPLGKLNVGLDLFPAPKPNISADFCSIAEVGEAIATGVEHLGEALEDFGESVGNAITSCFGFC